jgi:hypothetical protein
MAAETDPQARQPAREMTRFRSPMKPACDEPEAFQPTEAALDDIAPLVCALVETVESYSVGLVWDHRFCAALDDVGTKLVAVIPLIGDERRHRRSKRKKRRRSGNICVLAGSEMKCARSAVRITQRVDFRGASAT